MVAAVGGFLFGYDLGIISGVNIFLEKAFSLTADQLGWVTGSALLGCMFGPLLGGLLSDRLGRKRTLILAGLLFAGGAIGSAQPRTILEFDLYRFLGGIGVGLASVASPMFIAEMSPSKIRGALVTVNQLAIVTGLMCSVLVSYWLSFGGHWGWMLASNAFPVPFLVVGLLLVPDSPRWLAQKMRTAEAIRVLTLIGGRQNAETEIAAITASLQETGTLRELLRPGLRLALVIACALAIFQQITGVSILLMYTPIIFQKAGSLSVSDAISQNVWVAGWNVCCTIVSMLVVDRLGRRPLLLAGTAGMAIGLGLMGLFFHLKLTGNYILLTMFVCVGAYIMSLAPLAWLIMSEIFPNHLRGRAMAIGSTCVWTASFLTARYFPLLMQKCEDVVGTPAVAFWVFAGVCVAAFLFSAVFVPETKGRTLEEIGASWTKIPHS
jgi:sugar porter (SP) family MFS transporter